MYIYLCYTVMFSFSMNNPHTAKERNRNLDCSWIDGRTWFVRQAFQDKKLNFCLPTSPTRPSIHKWSKFQFLSFLIDGSTRFGWQTFQNMKLNSCLRTRLMLPSIHKWIKFQFLSYIIDGSKWLVCRLERH